MKKILVTGAGGQLSTEFNYLASLLETNTFVFAGQSDLDITVGGEVEQFLKQGGFDLVINCAAYTAVDKAESEKETAYAVNSTGAEILAKLCAASKIRLLHFSTDFVFDGSLSRPYNETDAANPLSVYGKSKLEGEQSVLKYQPDAIVIRTSWVYSSFGHNFVKTILRLCSERSELNIVDDQIGSPTYARDLAKAVLHVIQQPHWKAGMYHYSNEGVASWYDFAVAIKEMAGLNTRINPISTKGYPTAAVRPPYSVLSKQHFKETYSVGIPYWRDSLKECLSLLL